MDEIIAGHRIAGRVFDRGAARPLLALHCSLAHSGAWAGLAARLSGGTVTAIDLPGHGRSDDITPPEALHDTGTAVATALMQRLGQGGPVDLIGHSLGATISLRLALDHPGLIRSLTLVEPVIFAAARDAALFPAFAAAQAQGAALMAADPAAGAAAFHAEWGAGERLADLPDRQRRYIIDRIGLVPAQNAVLMQDAPGMLAPGRLEALRAPVLLIRGADSPAIVPAIHAALLARLPHAAEAVVAGAGHMVPITHAGAVGPLVQAHLDAV